MEQVRRHLPQLPDETRSRLPSVYGISLTDTEALITMDEAGGSGVTLFEQVIALLDPPIETEPKLGEASTATTSPIGPKQVASWITNNLVRELSKRNEQWSRDSLSPETLAALLALIKHDKLLATAAKQLLQSILDKPGPSRSLNLASLESMAQDLGLLSAQNTSGDDSLKSLCAEVIAQLPAEAERVRGGKEKVVMRLVGELMKQSRGTVDPVKAKEVFLQMLLPESKP